MKTIILNLLKKPLFWAILLAIALVASIGISSNKIKKQRAEIERLEINQQTLIEQVQYYEDENGAQVATIQALTLQKSEFESLMPQYAREIKDLRLKVKDLESIAHASTSTTAEITAPLIDYVPRQTMDERIQAVTDSLAALYAGVKTFHWSDGWLSISGEVMNDSVKCRVENIDSLTLVVHRERKRCLFRRKGKILHYDIKSANPHTSVKDIQYIEIVE
ncbi:MAG: hypothetical protein J6U95_01165 [Alistipes sp.]|nr:hypothetical protein [Alistipes sp.]